MIGRFSNLGSYRELMNMKDFLVVSFAGGLAFAGYIIDRNAGTPSVLGLVLLLSSIGINGAPIIIDAVKGIFHRKVNVDELVSIAIIACLFSGEYLTAATVSFVMVLGSLIEEATAESARKAIQALVKISPENAMVVENGEERSIPVENVKKGDVLLVKAGERIPVDAVILSGITAVDESSITGEPVPVEKGAGDLVFAGTLNQNGLIHIETTKVGRDTTLGKVIQLVLDAETHKPESIALIDRYAKWFTPFILICAAIAWGITGEVSRAVTVLIVGCPCALILAAPTAIIATISRAAKAGILIKGGQYIENIASANAVLFDKTGTLTKGKPSVDRIIPNDGIEKNYILKQAACLEQNSTHPLARAILKAAGDAKIPIAGAEELFTEIGVGLRGIVAGDVVEVGSVALLEGGISLPVNLKKELSLIQDDGATPLVVLQNKELLGVISVTDRIRPMAEATVKKLRALDILKIGILSGDHEKAVQRVGKTVGTSDNWAGLKPDGKLKILKDIQKAGHRVLFVGDGINDAPALAASDVGIAMGAKGTEVALETADIALMNDDISKLPFLVELSKRMVFIIKINIAFGLMFNLIAVVVSGMGVITPIMGAIVHNVGSILVVLSSASIGFASEKK